MPTDALSDIGVTIGSTGAHRPAVMGTRHMVAAGHYGAAHAAFTILESGGNAVDAGVAAGLALGVLQCDIVNVAGVAPIICYDAATRRAETISGLGCWPRLADVEVFRREHGGRIPEGLLRTVVPAAPDAWITALARHGTMSFAEVAGAAIGFARAGFPMYPLLAGMLQMNEAGYRRWDSNAAIFLPGGRLPEVGEIFVQADLARTLQYMVDEEKAHSDKGRAAGLGAARNAFYAGDIAAAIVGFHRENGGWLRADDLKDFHSEVETPLRLRFGEVEVFTCGPWCQGPSLLQALSLLDTAEFRSLEHNSADYLHVVCEALKLAFADREHWYGDPRFVDVPLDRLLSPAYAADRRRQIERERAFPGMPAPGGAEGRPYAASPGAPAIARDTSYVCVVDGYGNAFSATPSDISSDTIVIPGTGLCLSLSETLNGWRAAANRGILVPDGRCSHAAVVCA
jgi:gamma-glutamyltranspeptidase/glutathione hydrolase